MWNVSDFEHAETVAQDLGIPPWVFVTVVCLLVLLPLCYMWTCVRNGVQNVRCCVPVGSAHSLHSRESLCRAGGRTAAGA